MIETRKQHWDHVYSGRPETAFSWFEADPVLSLQQLRAAGLRPDS